MAQTFSFEFSEIFKNTFFKEYLRTTASGDDLSQSYVTSVLSCDTLVCNNSSDQTEFAEESPDTILSQDDELLRILEDLQCESHVNNNNQESEVLFGPTQFSI